MKKAEKPNKFLLFPDHRKPMTRRDFLSAGIIDGAALMMVPTALRILTTASEARAAGMAIPFKVFDGAGGLSNVVEIAPGGKGGPMDLLSADYSTLGYTAPPADANLTSMFGVRWQQNSPMLAGILSQFDPVGDPVLFQRLQTSVLMSLICAVGNDDSNGNRINPVLAAAQVYKGSLISNPLGRQNTPSGGNSSVPTVISSLAPVAVNSFSDAAGSTGLGGELINRTSAVRGAFANLLSGLASAQAGGLANFFRGLSFGQQSQTAAQGVIPLVNGVPGTDPRIDTILSQVYGITAASSNTDPNVINATLDLFNLTMKSGPVVQTIGGCDYHTGNSTAFKAKNQEVGVAIGRYIKAALLMNQEAFAALISDGGIVFDAQQNALGDSGSRGAAVQIHIKPIEAGGPKLVTGSVPQIGFFSPNQTVDQSSIVGTGQEKIAAAIFLNYLNIMGRAGDFQSIMGNIFAQSAITTPLNGIPANNLLVHTG